MEQSTSYDGQCRVNVRANVQVRSGRIPCFLEFAFSHASLMCSMVVIELSAWGCRCFSVMLHLWCEVVCWNMTATLGISDDLIMKPPFSTAKEYMILSTCYLRDSLRCQVDIYQGPWTITRYQHIQVNLIHLQFKRGSNILKRRESP